MSQAGTFDTGGSGPGGSDLHVAKLIINSTPLAGGNYTTIAAALAAASAGDTVFVMPGSTGTYTEDLTLPAGVNLTAFEGDSLNPNVTIIGKITASYNGYATISGIRLQTNSDYAIVVSGSNNTILNLKNCYINCTNHTGINLTSSGDLSELVLISSNGDIGTTGIAIFTGNNLCDISILSSNFTNNGASTTLNSLTGGGNIVIEYSTIENPVSISSSGSIGIYHSIIDTGTQNVTPVTCNGTGGGHLIDSVFNAGSASALSIGAGVTIFVDTLHVDSSNTNAITGDGTLKYGYIGNESAGGINTTTITPFNSFIGKLNLGSALTNANQPCFNVSLTTSVSNITGNGNVYKVLFDTINFDQASNITLNSAGNTIFTAPVTGNYYLEFDGVMENVVDPAISVASALITTTSGGVQTFLTNIGITKDGNNNSGFSVNGVLNMSVGDTAYCSLFAFNGSSNSINLGGFSNQVTNFSGYLIA